MGVAPCLEHIAGSSGQTLQEVVHASFGHDKRRWVGGICDSEAVSVVQQSRNEEGVEQCEQLQQMLQHCSSSGVAQMQHDAVKL